jgi:hypothetical protein
MSMQSTVLTRAALERVGTPSAKYRIASDYAWLALLCRAFTTNMVNAPGTIKHEHVAGKKPLAEGHLVTGKTALRFHQDILQIFEDLFWKDATEPGASWHSRLPALQDRRGAARGGRAPCRLLAYAGGHLVGYLRTMHRCLAPALPLSTPEFLSLKRSNTTS